jgi:hypothetical protein
LGFGIVRKSVPATRKPANWLPALVLLAPVVVTVLDATARISLAVIKPLSRLAFCTVDTAWLVLLRAVRLMLTWSEAAPDCTYEGRDKLPTELLDVPGAP